MLSKPGVVNDLSSAPDSPVGVDTAAAWQQQIMNNLWLTGADVDRFAAGGTLITDDRPYTEYDLLRHLFGPKFPNGFAREPARGHAALDGPGLSLGRGTRPDLKHRRSDTHPFSGPTASVLL